MNFYERNGATIEFEAKLLLKLRGAGWVAEHIGQGLVPASCRDALRNFCDLSGRPSLLRWFPDVFTFVPSRPKSVRLLDAKACGGKTGNYAIEVSALETAEIIIDSFFTPVFFIFDDYGVLTAREARQRGRPGMQGSNGSGTEYLLVAKNFSRSFEQAFPSVDLP